MVFSPKMAAIDLLKLSSKLISNRPSSLSSTSRQSIWSSHSEDSVQPLDLLATSSHPSSCFTSSGPLVESSKRSTCSRTKTSSCCILRPSVPTRWRCKTSKISWTSLRCRRTMLKLTTKNSCQAYISKSMCWTQRLPKLLRAKVHPLKNTKRWKFRRRLIRRCLKKTTKKLILRWSKR